MSSHTRDSVQAGVCFDNTSDSCALEKTACTDPSTFMSSREIQNFANGHGGNCVKSRFVNAIGIGRCTGGGSGDGHCASDPSLCAAGSSFTAAMADGPTATSTSNGCKVQEGDPTMGIPTAYGRCGGVDCVWSADDCGEAFVLDPTCTCDKVIVGACAKDGLVFCAVSRDACDDDSQWLWPQELRLQTNTDCYLCRTFEDPTASKPEVTAPNTGSSSATLSSSISNSNNEKSALIGGIVGRVVGAVVIAAIALVVIKIKKRNESGIEKNPPPSEVDMSELDMESENVSEIGDYNNNE